MKISNNTVSHVERLYPVAFRKKDEGARGIHLFVFLSLCFAVSQAFYYAEMGTLFLVLSLLLVAFLFEATMFYLSIPDVFFLIFFLASTRIITGIGGHRELQDLTLALLFGVLFLVRMGTLKRVRVPRIFWVYSALIMLVVINGIQAPFGSEVTGFLRRWQFITSLVSFLAGFYLSTSVSFSRFTKVMFYFYLTVMVIAFIMFFADIQQMPLFNTFSWELLKDYGGRFGILSVAGSICFTILLCKKDFARSWRLRVPTYILSLLAVVAGGGRAALVGIVVSFFVYLYFVRGKRVVVLIALFIGFVVIQSTSIPLVRRYVPNEFQRVFDFGRIDMLSYALREIGAEHINLDVFARSEADYSTIGRLTLWTEALSSIPHNPWLGRGVGALYVGESKSSITAQQMMSNQALLESGDLHNTYISLAYTFGIPALLMFLVLVARGTVYSRKLALLSQSEYAFIYVYFVSLLVQALAGDLYFDYQFMFILGMIYSRYIKLKKVKLTLGA